MDALRGCSILVTGANGFVGRHLCPVLRNNGCVVHAVGRKILMDSFYYSCDLRDKTKISLLLQELAPDYVIHLATVKKRDGISLSDYRLFYEENFITSLNLIEACDQVKTVRRFIYLGSCEEYGVQQSPFKETQKEMPLSAYGVSKLAVTQLLQSLVNSSHFSSVVLRPSLIYGPGQRHDMFLPAMLYSLIHEKFFDMTHGVQTRDYIYIDDVVRAIISSLCFDLDNKVEIMNISSAQPILIKSLALMSAQLIGNNSEQYLNFGAKAYRPQEAMEYSAENHRAKIKLNFSPEVALADGLLRTIESIRNSECLTYAS